MSPNTQIIVACTIIAICAVGSFFGGIMLKDAEGRKRGILVTINEKSGGVTFIKMEKGKLTAIGNKFIGKGTMLDMKDGEAKLKDNIHIQDISKLKSNDDKKTKEQIVDNIKRSTFLLLLRLYPMNYFHTSSFLYNE